MCLALPARLVSIAAAHAAVVDMGGIRKTISIELVPSAQVGDYVIVHVGHAIGTLDEAEALATLALFAELERSQA
jgi:hydrogenase expression/formation protein HypC